MPFSDVPSWSAHPEPWIDILTVQAPHNDLVPVISNGAAEETDLPLLGITLQHRRILRLVIFRHIPRFIFKWQRMDFSLMFLVLTESAIVSLSTGMGEEMRSNWLEDKLSRFCTLDSQRLRTNTWQRVHCLEVDICRKRDVYLWRGRYYRQCSCCHQWNLMITKIWKN